MDTPSRADSVPLEYGRARFGGTNFSSSAPPLSTNDFIYPAPSASVQNFGPSGPSAPSASSDYTAKKFRASAPVAPHISGVKKPNLSAPAAQKVPSYLLPYKPSNRSDTSWRNSFTTEPQMDWAMPQTRILPEMSMGTMVHLIFSIIHVPLTIVHLILLYTSRPFMTSKWKRHILHTIVIGMLCVDFLIHTTGGDFNAMNLLSTALDTIFVITFGVLYFTQPLSGNRNKIVGANIGFLILNILLVIGWINSV